MSEIKIGEEYFNVLVEGPENEPFLTLSNSLGCDLHMWDAQIPHFTKHFRVVRYDSRGHGGSAVSAGPYSLARLADDALAILDAIGAEKTHWLGLSKGGMVGQWLLTHAPHRLDRVVLANTSSHMPPAGLWNARIRAVREKGMEAVAPAVIGRWFSKTFMDDAPQAVAAIEKTLKAIDPEGYVACAAAIRDMDQRESLRGVKNKQVLIIVGAADPATPPEHGQVIAQAIEGAKLVTLNAAHLSNIEQAEPFAAAVLDFLTKPAKKAMAPSRHAPGRKPPRKTATGVVRKATAKKIAAKKAAAKKGARKEDAKKKAAKAAKRPAKKTAARKPVAKKSVAKKLIAKTVKKPAGKKAAAKKPRAKKASTKKTPAKKTAKKRARPKNQFGRRALNDTQDPASIGGAAAWPIGIRLDGQMALSRSCCARSSRSSRRKSAPERTCNPTAPGTACTNRSCGRWTLPFET